ncbi:MAG: cytochrome c oxidase subunit I [Phycisphaeraceae bacterium]|nr:cytochrome c oxidase subunit I [Phycisphaeraceae bacterium]
MSTLSTGHGASTPAGGGSVPDTRRPGAARDSGRVDLMARLHEWTVTVDHKRLGILYVASGLFFFVIAGIQATLMRLQLVVPVNDFLTPDTFNRLFTMHGTTMVFLVGMPVLLGIANFLVPLMIGARDMAFPRLNAFGFWLFLFGGLLLYYSYIGSAGLYGAGSTPDAGWFMYAPLTTRSFSRGNATDYWILGIMVSGFGSMTTAVNLVATIFSMRCPGMTLMRMPLLVWMMIVVAVLILAVMPVLTAAQVMLLFDRSLGAHFFNPQQEGSALLWQHLFWFFGHPEVYILILPAFGFISEIIPVFSRKVIFGYPLMVAATVAICFISLGVWAHHMFVAGLSPFLNALFAASTFLISVPTGIKIFNWIGTMWGGRIRFDVPMLFATGFLALFVFGGLTGIMLAVVPFDWQLSDTYFVVGHFHYVLIGGTLFGIFGAIFYWFPKAFGCKLDERLGKWTFWIFLIGFTLTFFPMHISGMLGMPRRIYTYQPDRGWELWNLISTIGVPLQIAGVSILVWNIIRTLRRGEPCGDDPWDAWTLEWATTSPPPEWNFHEVPVCTSRRPLWDRKHPEDPDEHYE